ncbi:MAG TPA: hypothetical protein VKE42_00695, partial [Candidatus Cybelea sp.]|nr:hypothetical protein [Candidatus Cybelea sp.]
QGGSFTGFGGNQRAGMFSQFSTGQYQFFRGGNVVPQMPTATATTARAGEIPQWQSGGATQRSSADVNINVSVPHGHRVTHRARGRGVLAHPKVNTSRRTQMATHSEQHPAQDENLLPPG